MARLPRGILGPIIGTLGSLTGSTWKGIPYVKQKREKSASKKIRTPKQLANEAKFKYINEWLVPFHPYIKVGYKNHAYHKTEVAAALSVNYKTVFSGDYPNIEIDYSSLIISKGSLPILLSLTAELIAADTLQITWDQNAIYRAEYDDQILLVAYSPALGNVCGFIGAANRADQHAELKLDQEMVGYALEVYIGVTSVDRKSISNSQYIGRIEPL